MNKRKLVLEGFNYTNNTLVRINALELDKYWKTDGYNQETSFEDLFIEEDEKIIEIDLRCWESESWERLFKYCLECELSYISILKEYKNRGYSGNRSLDHMDDKCFVILAFDSDLTNVDEADALFEYREGMGEFDYMLEEHKSYLDKEKMLYDWQINVGLPVIEVEHNAFAILFRDK